MNVFFSPRAGSIREGGFFLVLALFLGFFGYGLHDGGQWSLSPALFPVILSSGLGVLSLALIGQGFLQVRAGQVRKTDGYPVSPLRTAGAFILCLLYAAALPSGGFIPVTAVFLALFTLFTGERRPLVIALVSLVSPLAVWLIFRMGLSVLLP